MSRKFQRGLSNTLLQDLLHGPCGTVLRACRDAGLDVRLRDNYLNLYFRGRSLARISGRRRCPAKLEIHHKYVIADRIGHYAGRRSKNYCAFDIDAAFAEVYAAHLDTTIRRACDFVGPEEDVELRLLERNDSTGLRVLFRSTGPGAWYPAHTRPRGLARQPGAGPRGYRGKALS